MSTPTQRSKKLLESRGYLVAIVERWNPYARIRQDLFGFIDLLALRGNETLAVQTTSGSNVSARIHKINETQAAAIWLESPTRKIIVHGWAKRGELGKRKLWDCREVEIRPKADAAEETIIPPTELATRWTDAMHAIAKADLHNDL